MCNSWPFLACHRTEVQPLMVAGQSLGEGGDLHGPDGSHGYSSHRPSTQTQLSAGSLSSRPWPEAEFTAQALANRCSPGWVADHDHIDPHCLTITKLTDETDSG